MFCLICGCEAIVLFTQATLRSHFLMLTVHILATLIETQKKEKNWQHANVRSACMWNHLNTNAYLITELFFRGGGRRGAMWYSDTTGILQSAAITPGLMTTGQRKSDKQPPRPKPLAQHYSKLNSVYWTTETPSTSRGGNFGEKSKNSNREVVNKKKREKEKKWPRCSEAERITSGPAATLQM